MITFSLYALAAVFLGSVVAFVYAYRTAPEGIQTEEGFVAKRQPLPARAVPSERLFRRDNSTARHTA